ncbi:hypothetical protein H0H92_015111, partial [Tricholoma furcatifolium]
MITSSEEDAMLAARDDRAAARDSYSNIQPILETNTGVPIGAQWASGGHPFTARIQSFRVADDQQRMLLPVLNMMIKLDMQEIYGSPAFFYSLFSDDEVEIKKFKVDNFIESNSLAFNEKHQVHAVGALENEAHAALYLNYICYAAQQYQLGKTANIDIRRYWSAGMRNRTIATGPWRAKPDLILVALGSDSVTYKDEDLYWPDVLAVAEMSSSP